MVSAVEATFGLGEALVSGSVNPDTFAVSTGAVVAKAIANKRAATRAEPSDGTREEPREPARQNEPALYVAPVLALVDTARSTNKPCSTPTHHAGCPVNAQLHP